MYSWYSDFHILFLFHLAHNLNKGAEIVMNGPKFSLMVVTKNKI